MRKALIRVQGVPAGVLYEEEPRRRYVFDYYESYEGPPVSLTIPRSIRRHEFAGFPPFFDGLLPEGTQLDALLREAKLDRDDAFGQLITVGADLVGAVSVEPLHE